MKTDSYYYTTTSSSIVFIHAGKEINCDYNCNIERFISNLELDKECKIGIILNELVFLHAPLLNALLRLSEIFNDRLILLDVPDFIIHLLQQWNLTKRFNIEKSWQYDMNYIKRFDDAIEICQSTRNFIRRLK